VVALESTIISHGMPYPQNLETALQARRALRPPRFQRLSCMHSVPGCASRTIRRPASAAGGGSREGARRDACNHRRPGRRAACGPDRRAAAPCRGRVRPCRAHLQGFGRGTAVSHKAGRCLPQRLPPALPAPGIQRCTLPRQRQGEQLRVTEAARRPGFTERLPRADRGARVRKTSRRDLPMVMAAGADGATTVSATMVLAAHAGIHIFVTGGEPHTSAALLPARRRAPRPGPGGAPRQASAAWTSAAVAPDGLPKAARRAR